LNCRARIGYYGLGCSQRSRGAVRRPTRDARIEELFMQFRVRAPFARARITPAIALLCSACGPFDLTAAEMEQLETLEVTPSSLPPSPTNAYADRADAAALGRLLFFDRRLSSDGTVACVDCHDPDLGFSDDRRVSEGVEGRLGARHSLPITMAAIQPFLLWDGRADSVWRQPLLALENEREMNFTRTDVALFVSSTIASDYERVFGALPEIGAVPPRVRPGSPEWDALPAETRDAVQRIFVNVGKSFEAYERLIVCNDTRFDAWIRGEIALDQSELEGAAAFVRDGCIRCHDGPALSDGLFHNLGLVRSDDVVADTGREGALSQLLADELNTAGAYSDDPEVGASRLAAAAGEDSTLGAFRTASLRGVTQRPRFGHLGTHTDLGDFIRDTYNRRRRGNDVLGTVDPILRNVDVDGDTGALIDFLRTLECPELPPELLAP
jgi:cytochrome c peroxidase